MHNNYEFSEKSPTLIPLALCIHPCPLLHLFLVLSSLLYLQISMQFLFFFQFFGYMNSCTVTSCLWKLQKPSKISILIYTLNVQMKGGF